MTNDTARTVDAMERLERCKTDGEIILKGKLKRCRVSLYLEFYIYNQPINTCNKVM